MTDHLDPEQNDRALADLSALIGRADVWDDPPPELGEVVVAAIVGTADAEPPVRIDRRGPRWRPTQMLAAAAALVLVVAGVSLLVRGSAPTDTIELSATDAAPDATATVEADATPAGLKLVLDTDGLDGAPDGYMYEAWVGNDDTAISAGTFHLRGGDGPIELWAGVASPEFSRFWITMEPIDDDTSPSGDTVLRGQLELDG